MKYIFDFDDFSPRNSNFALLDEIHEHFPKFRVTLFTVPWEVRFATATPITNYIEVKDTNGQTHKEREFGRWIEAVKQYDWLEIALHGLTHVPEEFLKLSYEEARKRLLVGEKMLINTGIPYVKLFKAPFWQLSPDAKRAAEDLGWIVCEDHYYNWNLKDEEPTKAKEPIIAHGHIQLTSGNGLEEVFHKIMRISSESEFGFLSEHFGATRIDPATLDLSDPIAATEVIYKGVRI